MLSAGLESVAGSVHAATRWLEKWRHDGERGREREREVRAASHLTPDGERGSQREAREKEAVKRGRRDREHCTRLANGDGKTHRERQEVTERDGKTGGDEEVELLASRAATAAA